MLTPAGPVRTCVGCRRRAPASELVRIVGTAHRDGVTVLVPDPTRTRPGRGAHLHPDPACYTLADRRHAFGRALRLAGAADAGKVREYLARLGTPDGGAVAPPDTQGRTTDMSTR